MDLHNSSRIGRVSSARILFLIINESYAPGSLRLELCWTALGEEFASIARFSYKIIRLYLRKGIGMRKSFSK